MASIQTLENAEVCLKALKHDATELLVRMASQIFGTYLTNLSISLHLLQ
jgi:hypothetical protein